MDHSKQLGEGKVLNLLIKFSLPAIVGMLVNGLYNVVSRMFIGNAEGALGIAGLTICFPPMLITMAFMVLIGIGANTMVSIKLGEGKRDEAEKIFGNSVSLFIIISLVITLVGLVFLDPMLKLFGASHDVLPYARAYMGIILTGTIFQAFSLGMNNFIRGEGNPKVAMGTMLMGAGINIILTPLFIFVFGMGVTGAAIATVLAQLSSSVWVMTYFLSKRSSLKIRKENLKLDIHRVRTIFSLGSAPFFMQLATALINLILNWSLINYGGDIAISGMGIVTSLQFLVTMPLFGITQGVQPIIGYNYGAKNYSRVREALKLAIIGAMAIACIGFLFIEIFPAQIVSLFNRNNPALIEFTVYAVRVFMMCLPILGFQIIGSQYFQAVGKPRESAILGLSRQIILFTPAVLVLPIIFGLHGVIIAGPAADFLSTVLTGIWLLKEMKHLGHKHNESLILIEAEEAEKEIKMQVQDI